MRTLERFLTRSRRAIAVAMTAGLTACGGGGGGGGGGPVETLDLSAANRDTVAHAVVASAVGLGGADAFLPTAAAAKVQRALAQSARQGRARALAVGPPSVRDCAVSGTETTTEDDRDNSGGPTVGDVWTIVYAQCSDDPGETLNGTVAATITQLDTATLAVRMVFTALASVTDGHSARMDGATIATLTEPSSMTLRIRLATDGPVTAVLATPVFSDTVTLESGFVQQSDQDFTTQETTTTISGMVRSARAGGTVGVATQTRFRNPWTEEYPRSGVALITGRTGVLRVTALSAAEVRLELDADEDGSYESASTVTWDWLI